MRHVAWSRRTRSVASKPEFRWLFPLFRKMNFWKIKKTISAWNRERLAKRRLRVRTIDKATYSQWIKQFAELTPVESEQLRIKCADCGPTFSVLLPVLGQSSQHLNALVRSILGQLHSRLELCITASDDSDKNLLEFLKKLRVEDGRVKLELVASGSAESELLNKALGLAQGEFVVLVPGSGLLANYALASVSRLLEKKPESDLIYADDDEVGISGVRCNPHFKPQWNKYLLRSQNYIGDFAIVRRSLLVAAGGVKSGFSGAERHELYLRCSELLKPEQIVHIPLLLCQYRIGVKKFGQQQIEGSCRAVQEHLNRLGIAAEVSVDGVLCRVCYKLPEILPLVSLIVLTRDRPELLDKCVRSILEKTTYSRFEMIIVDNGTVDISSLNFIDEFSRDPRVKVIRDSSEFNYSALNNRGAELATGQFLCLLNNDVEVLNGDWLGEMVSVALQPEVGAVGARLYYPNGRLQHAGVVLGIGDVAGHPFRHQHRDDPHYMYRSQSLQELSVVTAACVLTPSRLYRELGGLDAENLAVAYNDVDYCLKVCESHGKVIYTPYAELIHHESISRGADDSPAKKFRLSKETEYMRRRWSDWIGFDRAYNPNCTAENEYFGQSFSSSMRFYLLSL